MYKNSNNIYIRLFSSRIVEVYGDIIIINNSLIDCNQLPYYVETVVVSIIVTCHGN